MIRQHKEVIGDATLYLGDMLDVVPALSDIDAVVTDSPYGLKFMGKDWDRDVPGKRYWQVMLDACKPGAHLLAFGGTRTYHRLVCAIEDAGWEIQDTILWVYASGFPKNYNIAWDLHKKACEICGIMVMYDHDNERTTRSIQEAKYNLRFVRAAYLQTPVYACAECGQILQPFMPEQSPQEHRAAWSQSESLWPQQPSMEGRSNLEASEEELSRCQICQMSHGMVADGAEGWIHHRTSFNNGSIPWQISEPDGSCPSYRPQSIEQLARQPDAIRLERAAQKSRGWGTALKPAVELICLARKPLSEKTVTANVLKHGVGGLNIGECRIPVDPDIDASQLRTMLQGQREEASGWGLSKKGENISQVVRPGGRWPANLIHDGSEEVLSLFPQTSSGVMKTGTRRATQDHPGSVCYGTYGGDTTAIDTYGDAGTAARFFYCAKANKKDRDEGIPEGMTNTHPTVKPTDLMRYLCRLITPPRGVILDSFMGSGSTGKGAILEGFRFIGVEKEEHPFNIACKRIDYACRQRYTQQQVQLSLG